MNINKKLSRAKQWAGEKMGAEAKTGVSDEFKNLEVEMQLRHDGMNNLHKSTTGYIKSLSKNTSGEDKERILPVAKLGQTMANHGDEFDPDSEFGNCLIGFGRAQERIARHQDTFVVKATGGWLEGLDRTLVEMKEYQNARKKLDSRRLAYDTSLSKLQKSKRDDFKAEEELRSQKAKYEESSEDVFRRMQDIKEAEDESVDDLTQLLETELEYFERCAEELRRLRSQWPAQQKKNQHNNGASRPGRPRSNTAHSYAERFAHSEIPEEPARPTIRSASTASRTVSTSYLQPQPQHSSSSSYYESQNQPQSSQASPARPYISRAQTAALPTRDRTPSSQGRMPMLERKGSFATEAAQGNLRSFLRPATTRIQTQDTQPQQHGYPRGDGGAKDCFMDPSDESAANSASSDRSPGGYSQGAYAYSQGSYSMGGARSVSPATSLGSVVGSGSAAGVSRQASCSNLLVGMPGNVGGGSAVGKKGPPPPPPSRSKKPAPPLPKVKRADMMA